MSRTFKLVAGLCVAFSLAAGGARATNLVTDGSFESLTSGYGQIGYNTNASGWTTSGYNFVFNSTNAVSGVTGSAGALALWGTGNGRPERDHGQPGRRKLHRRGWRL